MAIRFTFIFLLALCLSGCTFLSTTLDKPLPRQQPISLIAAFSNKAQFLHSGSKVSSPDFVDALFKATTNVGDTGTFEIDEFDHKVPQLNINQRVLDTLYTTLKKLGYQNVHTYTSDFLFPVIDAKDSPPSPKGRLWNTAPAGIAIIVTRGSNAAGFVGNIVSAARSPQISGYGIFYNTDSVGFGYGKTTHAFFFYQIIIKDIKTGKELAERYLQAQKTLKPAKPWPKSYQHVSKKHLEQLRSLINDTIQHDLPAQLETVLAIPQNQ